MENSKKTYAETYGNTFVAALPMITLFCGIIILSLCGMRSAKNLWSAGFAAILVGFFAYKDKNRFQEAILNGLRNRVYVILVVAFYFSGILAKVLSSSHLVDSLLWVASLTKLPAVYLPALTFLVGVVLSSSTGTTGGTVSTITPVMLPMAVAMGCNPAVMCGAIISGAFFGDNLAPISDTTIASALTQETTVIKVVRSRIKYSVVAGLFALVMFIIMGKSTTDLTAAASMSADATYAGSLVFLLIPVIIVIMMLKGANLVTALLVTDLLGFIMLFIFGYADFNGLVGTSGIIASGIESMASAATFVFFIFIVANIIREAGVLNSILDNSKKFAKTPKSAEVTASTITLCASLAIGGATSTISLCGAVVRELLRPFKIDRARSANILDGQACGVGGLLPYNSSLLLLAGLAISSGVVAGEFSPIDFLAYNYHCMGLAAVYWFAVISGWGRKFETEQELAVDGIVIDKEEK